MKHLFGKEIIHADTANAVLRNATAVACIGVGEVSGELVEGKVLLAKLEIGFFRLNEETPRRGNRLLQPHRIKSPERAQLEHYRIRGEVPQDFGKCASSCGSCTPRFNLSIRVSGYP